jgi:hypothetical protein
MVTQIATFFFTTVIGIGLGILAVEYSQRAVSERALCTAAGGVALANTEGSILCLNSNALINYRRPGGNRPFQFRI